MSMNRRQMRREIVAQRQQIFDLAEELQSRKKWSASSEERHVQELRESTVTLHTGPDSVAAPPVAAFDASDWSASYSGDDTLVWTDHGWTALKPRRET